MKYLHIILLTLLSIYCVLQFRSFLLEDYSDEYKICKKTDIQKLTQEHPSMPGWRFQFISTVITSVGTQKIDTIYIDRQNYNYDAVEKLSKYYSTKYKFFFIGTPQNIVFRDSTYCESYWLKKRYCAKWNIQKNKIFIKYDSYSF
jgi:hypothetical protein